MGDCEAIGDVVPSVAVRDRIDDRSVSLFVCRPIKQIFTEGNYCSHGARLIVQAIREI